MSKEDKLGTIVWGVIIIASVIIANDFQIVKLIINQ